MKGSFEGQKAGMKEMEPILAALDKVDPKYALLYDDGFGTHVVENCEDAEEFVGLVTAAILVIGDAHWLKGQQADFAAWLSKFIDEYGPEGSRAVYEEALAQGIYKEGA